MLKINKNIHFTWSREKDTVTCWECGGAGTVVEGGVRTPCPLCGGTGTQEV